MVSDDVAIDATPSMVEFVAALNQSPENEIRASLGEFDGDWSVSNVHSGGVFPIGLPESFVVPGRISCLGRVTTSNRILPPSPVLDGLLKPA
jgi:hypothetical protein